MARKIATAAALVIASTLVAGCSGLGDNFGPTTSALPEAPRVDPVCNQLAATIDGLRREGVPEKVEKAAAKKYRMKTADLAKAAQLNKANDDFQARCSNMPRTASVMSAPASTKAPAAKAPKATISSAAAVKASAPAVVAETTPPATSASSSDDLVRTARASTAPPSTETSSTTEAITASSSSSGGN
jgi:hypothetical protein